MNEEWSSAGRKAEGERGQKDKEVTTARERKGEKGQDKSGGRKTCEREKKKKEADWTARND